jgi:hypothetical protein
MLIPLSSKDSRLIFRYDEIIDNHILLENMLESLPESTWSTDSLLFKDIYKPIITYPNFSYPFIYNDDEEGKYFAKLDTVFDFLREYKNDLSLNIDTFSDSIRIVVMDLLPKYNEIYESEVSKNKEKNNRAAKRIRGTMVGVLNDTINYFYIKFLDQHLKNYFLSKFLLPTKFVDKSSKYFRKVVEKEYNDLTEIYNSKIFKAPYLEDPVSLKYLIITLSVVLLSLTIYVQLLYLNFKFYEVNVEFLQINELKEISIRNIFFNLGFSSKIFDIIISTLNIILVFILPITISTLPNIFFYKINKYLIILTFLYYSIILAIYLILGRKIIQNKFKTTPN